MPSVTIKPSGKTVESAEGSSLLEAILASGEPIAPKCDGNALCGNCHIFVHDGRKGISRIQTAETVELLGFASGL